MLGFCVRPRPKALVAFYGYGDIAGSWYSEPDAFYCRQALVPAREAYAAVGSKVISESPPGSDNRARFYLYCRQNGLWPKAVTGHDPHNNPEAFEPFCPLRNVDAAYPPTLLLHGDNDTDVPYEQSLLMAEQLARADIEHELVTIPNGGHGFDHQMGNATVARVFERVLAFLRAGQGIS